MRINEKKDALTIKMGGILSGKTEKRNPWSFIPTLYLAEGMPYILTNQLSVAMYKTLEASNAFIGMTSYLYIPWSIKLFWGPFVDGTSSKRTWILLMQLALSVLFALIAFGAHLDGFLAFTLIIFTLIAFASATHDIAIDGYYLHALERGEQAFFSGVRSAFYRIAMIFAGGILVSVAGWIGEASGDYQNGWSVAFFISAGIFALFLIFHKFILPYPPSDAPVKESLKSVPYKEIFREYFSQKKIGVILAFILLYRFGEGLLVKMAQPFLLDSASAGGLNVPLAKVGVMYGTVGVGALVVGGILGGWLAKKYKLKNLIFPMALAMNLPNLLYVFLSIAKPTQTFTFDLVGVIPGITLFTSAESIILSLPWVVQSAILVEQFGYGLGFTAFMVYLLYISKGKYRTSHYAISTGIMAVGMMIPGFLSGWMQDMLGYTGLFVASAILTIPGMLIIFLLPMKFEEESAQ